VATAEPQLSFVVTCKGRLAHLRQSMPGLMAQPGAEVIVVDYDCPDGAGAWVEKEWPAAQLVRVADAPIYSMARSRNLGARAARGEWLCFADADNLLREDYGRRMADLLKPGSYFRNEGAPGHVVCARADFEALTGYDEVIEGWGQEDQDLLLRLELLGRTAQAQPPELVATITHTNEERTRYFRQKDLHLSNLINGLYCQVKRDLMLLYREHGMVEEARRAIYADARAAVLQVAKGGEAEGKVTITMRQHRVRLSRGWRIERTWNYVLTPPPKPED
jgi:glycosyltransferase involved in cell wall biosynthesis